MTPIPKSSPQGMYTKEKSPYRIHVFAFPPCMLQFFHSSFFPFLHIGQHIVCRFNVGRPLAPTASIISFIWHSFRAAKSS